jgi:hypothetical protein
LLLPLLLPLLLLLPLFSCGQIHLGLLSALMLSRLGSVPVGARC